MGLNDHELVWVSERYEEDNECKTIYKYNVHKDEWCQFIDFPKDLEIESHSIAMKEDKKKLYLAGPQYGMIVLDIETKKWSSFKKNARDAVGCPVLLNVDGVIHKIGGYGNSQHLIWNDDKKAFKEIFDFKKEENIK